MIMIIICVLKKSRYHGQQRNIKYWKTREMKLKFLCEKHRMELTNEPGQAIHCWQNGFEAGQFLCHQKRWQEALPHLGCAFETSEIMMVTKAVDSRFACEVFTCTTLLLGNTFSELGYVAQSMEVYRMAIDRLEIELSHSAQREWINQYLDQLYTHLRDPAISSIPKAPWVAVH
jgi:hypothetical protein